MQFDADDFELVAWIAAASSASADGGGHVLDEVSEAARVSELDIESAGRVEAPGDFAPHLRSEGSDDFLEGDIGIGQGCLEAFADGGFAKDLVGGLGRAVGAVSSGNGSELAVATVCGICLDQFLLADCQGLSPDLFFVWPLWPFLLTKSMLLRGIDAIMAHGERCLLQAREPCGSLSTPPI